MCLRSCFFFTFCILSVYLNAQTCCSGGVPLSNNLGLPNLEKGSFQIGISYDYNNLNTLKDRTHTLNDNSRLRITHSVLINSSYAITNKLSVEGLFTWVNQRRKISQFGNENLDTSSGIGDAVLLMKYNFQNVFNKNSSLTLGLGTRVPFGSSTEKNSQGITLSADLQPGGNAWDVIYWLSSSKSLNFRPSLNLSTRLMYRSTGTNNSYLGNTTYKFGNEFQAFISISDEFIALKTNLSPSISFKYRNAQLDKTGGYHIDNTGGNWVFLIPSFSININPNLIFSTKVELPIYSNVDGTQLTPTYRLTSGFLYKISSKPNILNLN